jgi:HPt (histidine-containing phosphotransfer) domain-containing protein
MSTQLSTPAPTVFASSTPHPTPRQKPGGWFGKYREIVLAVAFFLVFDMAVLVMNFAISFQIAHDSVAINLAGRQRMLTQRVTKAVLAVQDDLAQGRPVATDLKELKGATHLFGMTLEALQHGGVVPGGDGKPVFLAAVNTAAGQATLGQALALWTPYQQAIRPLLSAPPTAASVAAVAAYGRAHNVKLLGQMNAVTSDLQDVSDQRANLLRLVQTGGIVLALINFVFILFKFIRRLRASDLAAEEANEENREILGSVNEGLFLLTPDLRLGSQISHSVSGIFGRAVQPNESFVDLLAPLVNAKTLDDAKGYVELLLSPHVKEQLARGLNPLSEVELRVANRLGETDTKFIALRFNRAHADDGSVRHLLVTVQDITAVVELQRKLASQHQHAQQEFEMLLGATQADPGALRQFVTRAEAQLLEVNSLLKAAGDVRAPAEWTRLMERVARLIHSFKGDSGALGLDMLAQKAHHFESELAVLRDGSERDGHDLLGLPPLLDDLLNKLKAFKLLAERLAPTRMAPMEAAAGTAIATSGAPVQAPMRPASALSEATSQPALALAQQLQTLAARVAADEGKQVAVQARVGALGDLPVETLERLREICVQLVRNAVVHGIELPAARQAAGKAGLGLVQVSLERADDGGYVLKAHDDGVGISVEHIRERLLQLGWFNAAQLDEMPPRDIVMQMFKPGFSTAAQTSTHAGRGVGLDVVLDAVKRLGGRIMLSTLPGRHTEFRVLFAA